MMNPRILGMVATLLAAATIPLLSGCAGGKAMTEQSKYGDADGREVEIYTLRNKSGSVARLTNYGATVTELWIPDRDGELADVVLGFDSLADYRARSPYFGCMAGRCANRIQNGRFEIDGHNYTLATNNGPNHLHGGVRGFDKVVWDATPFKSPEGPGVRFTYRSVDGEEGYPGNVDVSVAYTLTDANELKIITEATTDAPTVVNVVHHSYWNLGGQGAPTILDHELMLNADRYTPGDSTLVPTGAIASVAGTPFDFRTPRPIRSQIAAVPLPTPDDPGGYDLNYVVNGDPDAMRLGARVRDPASGRVMEIWSNQPGIQFYTGNFLDITGGKGGAAYPKHSGFCLETQHFPDAVNKRGLPGWPDPVLRPGETYRHEMVHRFSTE